MMNRMVSRILGILGAATLLAVSFHASAFSSEALLTLDWSKLSISISPDVGTYGIADRYSTASAYRSYYGSYYDAKDSAEDWSTPLSVSVGTNDAGSNATADSDALVTTSSFHGTTESLIDGYFFSSANTLRGASLKVNGGSGVLLVSIPATFSLAVLNSEPGSIFLAANADLRLFKFTEDGNYPNSESSGGNGNGGLEFYYSCDVCNASRTYNVMLSAAIGVNNGDLVYLNITTSSSTSIVNYDSVPLPAACWMFGPTVIALLRTGRRRDGNRVLMAT